MRESHRLEQGFISEDELRALRATLLKHPLIGPSPLKGSFYQTRGFAIIFTRAGIDELRQRFGGLSAFIDATCTPPPEPRSGWSRLQSEPAPCNAFYLNLLMVPAGTWVKRHVDATLRGHGGLSDVLPNRVSVLWLDTPRALAGGQLQIFEKESLLATITPRAGNLIHFRGDLGHAISPVVLDAEPSPETESLMRTSLVCEQYTLSEDELSGLPPFKVHSRAGFSAFLEDAGNRSTSPV